MDCRTFHRRLEDYLEGGLDFPGRFGMERHAKECYACEKEINAALSLRQAACELRKVTAPADFERSFLARVQAEKSHNRFWKVRNLWLYGFEDFSWRVASVTALLTVLVVGILGYIHFEALTNRPVGSQAAIGDDADRETQKGRDQDQAAVGRPGDATALSRLSAIDARSFSRFGRDTSAIPYAEPGDADFIDIMVPGPDGQQLIMQLPRTIRMRYGQPSREYFIRNVSH